MSTSVKKELTALLIFFCTFVCCIYSMTGQQIMGLERVEKPRAEEGSPKTVDDWREVPGTGGLWQIYSAFFSATPDGQQSVALVTIVDSTLKDETVFCHLWNSTDSFTSVEGEKVLLGPGTFDFFTGQVWCPTEDLKTGPFLRVTMTLSRRGKLKYNDALLINGDPEAFWSEETSENKLDDEKLVQSLAEDSPLSVTRHRAHEFQNSYEKWQKKNKSDDLVVCVRAIGEAYNNAAKIIEFVELHKILGAKFFYFYNLSIGADVDEVLKFYVKKGDAEVLPFSLPENAIKSIHQNGQKASQADCHLRASRFSLIAMLDLDEAFISREENNLIEMVNGMGYYASYLVRNVFFYNFCEDDSTFMSPTFTSETRTCSVRDKSAKGLKVNSTDMEASKSSHDNHSSESENNRDAKMELSPRLNVCTRQLEASLVSMKKTKRVVDAQDYGRRSKYIMRPLHVVTPTVHAVKQFQSDVPTDRRTYLVPVTKALSHHYRDCEMRNVHKCRAKKTTTDRTAHRYAQQLQSAVVNVFLELCGSDSRC